LSHILANPTAAVAPTAPLASVPAKPAPGAAGAARPIIGPVLPLTAADGSNEHLNVVDGGNLLGGGSGPAVTQDPIAKNVLVHGDALPAPPGRADNFAWPQGGPDANAAAAAPLQK
jgi:uncharacterized protein